MTFGSSSSSWPDRGVGVPALVEHVAPVADLQAAAGVLLDHDDRDPGLVDRWTRAITWSCTVGERPADGSSSSRTAGSHHGARHGDHLALAARQGPPAGLSARPARGKSRITDSNGPRTPRVEVDPHLEVLSDRQSGEHVASLGHVADCRARPARAAPLPVMSRPASPTVPGITVARGRTWPSRAWTCLARSGR